MSTRVGSVEQCCRRHSRERKVWVTLGLMLSGAAVVAPSWWPHCTDYHLLRRNSGATRLQLHAPRQLHSRDFGQRRPPAGASSSALGGEDGIQLIKGLSRRSFWTPWFRQDVCTSYHCAKLGILIRLTGSRDHYRRSLQHLSPGNQQAFVPVCHLSIDCWLHQTI
jgi:hypothetical protein